MRVPAPCGPRCSTDWMIGKFCEVVRSPVGIAWVVCRRADGAEELDAERPIVVNRVAADELPVTGGGFARQAADGAEGDDIGRTGRRAADRVVVGSADADEPTPDWLPRGLTPSRCVPMKLPWMTFPLVAR